MSEPYPIAIAISDLHLSLTPPCCRADGDRWLEVQAGYLQQVKDLRRRINPLKSLPIPILCAGDLFDRWNASPELINFALEHLPDEMICIPGNHDLPLHRSDLMHRSGYGVLKQVGKIRDISGKIEIFNSGLVVIGFGLEQDDFYEKRMKAGEMGSPIIALIHCYVWTEDKRYPGAPDTANISAFKKSLKGYDVAVFGDNHQSFITRTSSGCTVLNCGTFIRRKTDEIQHQPSVGIIVSDGTVMHEHLDTSSDRFHADAKDRPETAFNMKEFIESLEELGKHGLDFRAAVERHLKTEDLPEQTKQIILAALDNKV